MGRKSDCAGVVTLYNTRHALAYDNTKSEGIETE